MYTHSHAKFGDTFLSCSNILHNEDVVTALAVQGGVVWLGTRCGFIFVLDGSAMEEGKDPLLGLQYCGEGKVKSVVPIVPKRRVTAKLQVNGNKLTNGGLMLLAAFSGLRFFWLREGKTFST